MCWWNRLKRSLIIKADIVPWGARGYKAQQVPFNQNEIQLIPARSLAASSRNARCFIGRSAQIFVANIDAMLPNLLYQRFTN